MSRTSRTPDGHFSWPDEAARLVRRVAEPRRVADSVKSAIRRAARRLGFSFTRTYDFWYRRAATVTQEELEKLRNEAAKQAREAAIQSLVGLRRDLAESGQGESDDLLSSIDRALGTLGATIRSKGDAE